eukprot:COSAG01_NODE_1142_length_11533_cov_9.907381_6_plen_45_part_00
MRGGAPQAENARRRAQEKQARRGALAGKVRVRGEMMGGSSLGTG